MVFGDLVGVVIDALAHAVERRTSPSVEIRVTNGSEVAPSLTAVLSNRSQERMLGVRLVVRDRDGTEIVVEFDEVRADRVVEVGLRGVTRPSSVTLTWTDPRAVPQRIHLVGDHGSGPRSRGTASG